MGKESSLLILVRHGQADSFGCGSDVTRGITSHGAFEVQKTLETITRLGYSWQGALVSPADRTRQTYDLLAQTAKVQDIITLYDKALYDGGVKDVFGAIQDFSAANPLLKRILVVGHQMWISQIAAWLATSDSETQSKLERAFVTSGYAVLESKEPIFAWFEQTANLIACSAD